MQNRAEAFLEFVFIFVGMVLVEKGLCILYHDEYTVYTLINDLILTILIIFIEYEEEIIGSNRSIHYVLLNLCACLIAFLIKAILFWVLNINWTMMELLRIPVTLLVLIFLMRILQNMLIHKNRIRRC